MRSRLKIAFFGSSLVSAYWNGAATYYRGVCRALHERGHSVTFYESDAYDRQSHRDIPDPDYASVIVYSASSTAAVSRCLEDARHADLLIKASGNGVFDAFMESAILDQRTSRNIIAFWDVDAPATLDRVQSNPLDPFAALIPRYDVIFTYGGGEPVISAYHALGADRCTPIYNGLDPSTHFPAPASERFRCDLAFLGNRLPDREARMEEFFLKPAARLPEKLFLIGGNGWSDKLMPANVRDIGHVYTGNHNSLNCSARAVLNINRQSMARYGFSPATRVFEAAGAGACLITDAFEGVETFFTPGEEILVARDGQEVAELLNDLTPDRARSIGQGALRRALSQHTYDQRVALVERACEIAPARRRSSKALAAS